MTERRRFWPAGIAGRIALLFAALLIASLWASAAFYARDRGQTTIRLFSESVAERIGAVVPLLERTPPRERAALIPALSSPTLWIGLADRRRIPGGWRRDIEREREIAAFLPDLGRRVEIRIHHRWQRRRGPMLPHQFPQPPDLLNSRVKVLISVALEGGGWAHFVASTDTTSLRWALRTAFWTTVASLAIFAVAFS